MRQRKTIRVELTGRQREQILQATGKDAEAIEITLDALEEWIQEPENHG